MMRRMMLIAASCPSNRLPAVTKRNGAASAWAALAESCLAGVLMETPIRRYARQLLYRARPVRAIAHYPACVEVPCGTVQAKASLSKGGFHEIAPSGYGMCPASVSG